MKLLKKLFLVFTGIILSLCILELSLQTASITLKTIKNYKINEELKKKDSLTVLCLGESTTDKQWPPILQKILDEKSKNKKFTVIDGGLGGRNSDDIMFEVKTKYLKKQNIDIMVTMMGINDNVKDIENIKNFNLKLAALFYLIKAHIISSFSVKELRADDLNDADFDKKINALKENANLKNYEEAFKIYKYLRANFGYRKKEIFNASVSTLKSLGKFEELENIIKEISGEDPYFNIYETVEIFCRTHNTKELTKLFPDDNEEFLRNIITANIGEFLKLREILMKADIIFLVNEIDFVINSVTNDKIIQNKQHFGNIIGFKALNFYSDGDYIESAKCFDRQTKYLLANIPVNTKKNYTELANVCKDNNIKLIAMQYPVRNVLPLKIMLEDFGEVTFLSNEENFKEALKTHKIKDIFEDRFAGDFGHCTKLGNELIAENVAETILKLYDKE